MTLPGRISTRTFGILTEHNRGRRHGEVDTPLRGGGDDLWHVEVVLAPWIPRRAHPWLTTALWRSVHPVVSHLASDAAWDSERENRGEGI